jgi:ammonia channel protein AmtB
MGWVFFNASGTLVINFECRALHMVNTKTCIR